MKKITYLFAVVVSVFGLSICNVAQAQSSWGTQDTSINWNGFNWATLGVGGYDTNASGFGVVGTNLDLSLIDPTLLGITVDISVAKADTNANTRWRTSPGTDLSSALFGGTEIKFSFSQPVAFRRVSTAGAVAFGPGEIETYASNSGIDYLAQGGTLNLVGPGSIDAISPTPGGSFFITAEDYSTTEFAVRWDDDEGVISNQAIHFQIGSVAVPEPAAAGLIVILAMGLGIRRRRSK